MDPDDLIYVMFLDFILGFILGVILFLVAIAFTAP